MKTQIINLISLLGVLLLFSCKNVSTFPISAPSAANVEDRLIGKWKFTEDTNKHNFYAVTAGYTPNCYHVKFWNRGGTNPTFEAEMHCSKIGSSMFINVPYWEDGFTNRGFIFLKVLNTNADFSTMTTAAVADTTMRRLKNSDAVKAYVTKHLNDPHFYRDTAHFFKVK